MTEKLQNCDRPQQIEVDFSKGFFKGDKLQIGCVGLSDLHHVFWPMVFIVCDSENCENVRNCVGLMLQILKQCGISTVRFMLKDGGTAMQKAHEIIKKEMKENGETELIGRICMAHIPDLRGEAVICKYLLHIPREVLRLFWVGNNPL